jgi:hypothetical protein
MQHYEIAQDGGEVVIKVKGVTVNMLRVHDELVALREAVVEAHRIILHEMDNGRTPSRLQAKNGGKGLGYFEDILSGVKR